ncbi:MAG: hypothetical protein QXT41_04130 [Thermoplasmatales archaeon]
MAQKRDVVRIIRLLVMIQLFFLSVQFILGMWINLFANVTNPSSSENHLQYMSYVMSSFPEIMVHIAIGIIIGIISLILIAFSVKYKRIKILVISIANAIFVFLAGIAGILFLINFMSNNIFSFLMSISFLAVILADFSIVLYIPVPSSSSSMG